MGTSIVNDPISKTAPRTASDVCRCGTKKIRDRTSIDTIRIFGVNAAGKSLTYYRAGVGGRYELLKNCFPYLIEMISREACNLWSLNFRIFSRIFVKKKNVASNVPSSRIHPLSLSPPDSIDLFYLEASLKRSMRFFFKPACSREHQSRCSLRRYQEESEEERERNMKRLPYLGGPLVDKFTPGAS